MKKQAVLVVILLVSLRHVLVGIEDDEADCTGEVRSYYHEVIGIYV